MNHNTTIAIAETGAVAVENIHHFSDSFDVRIELEAKDLETVQSLYVYSASLKAASKIWAKFLEPGSGFPPPERVDIGSGQSVAILYLDGVSLDSAIIFFNILHYNFDDIRSEIDFKQLVDIAKLVDQFDCKKPFKLLGESWLNALHKNQQHMYDIEWLFVGSVFRGFPHCDEITERICQRLCRYTSNIGEGKLIVCSGYDRHKTHCYDTTLVPEQYLDHIEVQRIQNLQKIFVKIASFIQNIPSHKASMGLASSDVFCRNETCLDMISGSIRRWKYFELFTGTTSFPTFTEDLAVEELSWSFKSLKVSSIIGELKPGRYHDRDLIYLDHGSSNGFSGYSSQDVRIQPDHKGISGEKCCPLVSMVKDIQKEVVEIAEKIPSLKRLG